MPRLITCMVAVAIAMLVAACGSSGGGDGKHRIAMVSFANDPAFHEYEIGAEQAAKAARADLQIGHLTTFDASAEIQLINSLAAKQPDAMLVTVQDARAQQAQLHQLAQRGIKIVTYDSNAADPDAVPVETYVSSEYVSMGRQTAAALARLVGDRGTVLYVQLTPGNLGLGDHQRGFTDYMKTRPGIEMLPVQYNDGEDAKTASIVSATLAAHPDLAGIYLGTNEAGASGGVTALRQADATGRVKAVSLDANPTGVASLKAGYQQAIVSSHERQIGATAMRSAVGVLDGKTYPKTQLIGGCTITAENVDDPSVAACLYEAP